MRFTPDFYPESRFGGYTDIDGTVAFYTRVSALLRPESRVVDFGCGRGAYGEDPVRVRRDLRILKGRAGRVIGLDVDPAGAANPYLDEFRPLEDRCWPLPDSSADLVLADNVIEHLPAPEDFFIEARRVLKGGGSLCIRTPNAWSYVALISRLIPNRSHAAVLAKVKDRSQAGRCLPDLLPLQQPPGCPADAARLAALKGLPTATRLSRHTWLSPGWHMRWASCTRSLLRGGCGRPFLHLPVCESKSLELEMIRENPDLVIGIFPW